MISDGSTKNFQQFEDLPLPNEALSSLILHKNKILFFDNCSKVCYEMVDGSWKIHSTLVEFRGSFRISAVTTNYGTFIFGGEYSKYTYEYLLHGSSEWQIGKTKIPDGFSDGCAIALKSRPEIWLIGGYDTRKRILSFNLETHRFATLPTQLLVGRTRFQCSFLPNTNKIIVTGGYDLRSTEILDTVDESVTRDSANPLNQEGHIQNNWSNLTSFVKFFSEMSTSLPFSGNSSSASAPSVTMGSPMRARRSDHGIGIVTVNGLDRVAVFGGYGGIGSREGYLKSVEIYNPESEKWEDSKFELKEGKAFFGFVSVNNKLIMAD